MNRRLERWMPRLLGAAAALAAALAAAVLVFLLAAALPFFLAGSFESVFLSGWRPFAKPPQYGIGALIVGSALLAVLAVTLALPLSLGICAFAHGVGPRSLGRAVLALVHGMTAIPTVIYGFVAVILLVPVLRGVSTTGSGFSLLAAGLTLAILILPTIVLLLNARLEQVDPRLALACTALGMSPVQTLARVILPSCWRGIVAAVVLGFCRALGDTLIALMVAGNAAQAPTSVHDSVRALTAHIALVVATDWNSPEYRSVAGAGLVPFLMTTVLTTTLRRWEPRANEAAHATLGR